MSNMTGVISGAEQPTLAENISPSFGFLCVVHVAQSLVFCAIICSLLLVFVSMYFLVVILWVLHRFRLLITLLVSLTFPYRILKTSIMPWYILFRKRSSKTPTW